MRMALRNNSIEPKIMVSLEMTKDSKHDKYVDGRILMLLLYRRYPVSFPKIYFVIFGYFVTFCYILCTLYSQSFRVHRYKKIEILDKHFTKVV